MSSHRNVPVMSDHEHTPQHVGRDRVFTGPVYHEPWTGENRRAHGNIEYTERCTECGAERLVVSNQDDYEYSPWSLPPLHP